MARYIPAELVYTEEFDNKTDAQKREYAIKQLTRDEKENLINGKRDHKGHDIPEAEV